MSYRQKPFCTVGPHCRVHQEVYRDISVLLFPVVCPQGTNRNLTLANGKNMRQLKEFNFKKKKKIKFEWTKLSRVLRVVESGVRVLRC